MESLRVACLLVLTACVVACTEPDHGTLREELRAELEPKLRREIEAELLERLRHELEIRLAIELDTRLIALGLQEPGWKPPPPPEPEPAAAATTSAAAGAGDAAATGRTASGEDGEPAGPLAPVTVSRIAVAPRIERRQPAGGAERYAHDIGELYCYVEVANSQGPERTLHAVWLRDEVEHQRTALGIGRSPGWRTWARTRIGAGQAGAWRCELVGEDGSVLASSPFTVMPPLDEGADGAP